jgi:L-ribulose-5-phosphate 3-epimerase
MRDDFTRRRFLQASGAALAAGSLSQSAVPQLAAAENRVHGLRKAVKYSMIAGKGSVLKKFQLLKKLGFEGLDITSRLNYNEVRQAQKKTGVIAHGVVSYDHWRKPLSHFDPKVRSEGLESFLGAIKDAKQYGGTTVLLVPAVVNKDVAYGDAYRRSQTEIRKALPLAEKLGIKILLENVWNNFLLSPVEMARYIDEFESEMIGAYFDVGNIVRYGWPEHWILELGSRIGKLDIKEYSRELQNSKGPRAGFGVKLGEGDCDWQAVMKALKTIGFKGWATAEVGGGGEERLRDISQRMDRIFAG